MTNIDPTLLKQTYFQQVAEGLKGKNLQNENIDTNKDGSIQKEELEAYLKKKFPNIEDGAINRLFADLDANGNTGIDSNELEDFVNNIKAYNTVIDVVKAKGSSYSYLTNKNSWASQVTVAILNEVGNQSEITQQTIESLFNQFANKIAAEIYADQCIEEHFGNGKVPNYDAGGDNDLKTIIDNFVKNTTSTTDVKSGINALITAYEATSSSNYANENQIGILHNNGYNINDKSPLNKLQIATITNTVRNTLTTKDNDLKAKFSGDWKAQYNAALDSYIENLTAGKVQTDFSTLLETDADDFMNDETYLSVARQEAVANALGIGVPKTENGVTIASFKGEISNAIKAALTAKIGETLANAFIENGRVLEIVYKNILPSILEFAAKGDESIFNEDGTIKNSQLSKLIDKLVTLVAGNADQLLGSTDKLSKLKLEELDNIYNALTEAAKAEEDPTESLNKQRNACLIYCTAVASKNSRFEAEVKAVFGENYRSEIMTLMPSEIEDGMEKLQTRLKELGDASTFKIKASSFTGINAGLNFDENKQQSIEYIRTELAKVSRPDKPQFNVFNMSEFQSQMADYQSQMADYQSKLAAYNQLHQGIKGVFGTADYAGCINNIKDADELETKMQQVSKLLGTYIHLIDSTQTARTYDDAVKADDKALGNDLVTDITLEYANQTMPFDIKPQFTDANDNDIVVSQDRITYSVRGDAGMVTIENGNVTINSGDKEGVRDVVISIIVDGVEVSTLKLNINCKHKERPSIRNTATSFTWQDSDGNHTYSIADAMSDGSLSNTQSGKAELCGMVKGFNTARSNAKAKITDLLNALKASISPDCADYDKVENAIKTTQNYYYAAIDAATVTNGDGRVGDSFTYRNEVTGQDATSSEQSGMASSFIQSHIDGFGEIGQFAGTGGTGLRFGHDKERCTSKEKEYYCVYVEMHTLVSKFLEFLGA